MDLPNLLFAMRSVGPAEAPPHWKPPPALKPRFPPDRCSAAGCSEVLGLAGEKKTRSLWGHVCAREKDFLTRDCTIPLEKLTVNGLSMVSKVMYS